MLVLLDKFGQNNDAKERVWVVGINLKLGANVFHINSWNTHAFDPNSFSIFPMVMNFNQHVVS